MSKYLFVGFSTYTDDYTTTLNDKLYDFNLAKRDLLNQLYTKKGERLMMPNYGCIIWDILFDPLTQSLIDDITEDITNIINSDSRLKFKSLDIYEFDHGLQLNIFLYYSPWDVYENFSIEFDKRTSNI